MVEMVFAYGQIKQTPNICVAGIKQHCARISVCDSHYQELNRMYTLVPKLYLVAANRFLINVLRHAFRFLQTKMFRSLAYVYHHLVSNTYRIVQTMNVF